MSDLSKELQQLLYDLRDVIKTYQFSEISATEGLKAIGQLIDKYEEG